MNTKWGIVSRTMDLFTGEECKAYRPKVLFFCHYEEYLRTLIEFETFHKRDHEWSKGKNYIKFVPNVFIWG